MRVLRGNRIFDRMPEEVECEEIVSVHPSDAAALRLFGAERPGARL